MKSPTLTNVLFAVMLLATTRTGAWGQQCPDWSPKFDQIDDPAALQNLQTQRSRGWPNFNPANNGGANLQQSIAQGDQLIQQLQQNMQQDYQAWNQTRAYSNQTINVTAAECRSAGNANMAAACEYHNVKNMILGVEGMNDLMRCRAGLPAGPDTSFDSTASGISYPGGRSGGGSIPWDRGAASVADLNVSKRTSMVNAATRNWQPPVEQQAAQGALASNTKLADPFADAEVKGGGGSTSSANASSADSASSLTAESGTSAGSDSKWSDPLVASAPSADNVTPSVDPTPPTQAEITASLDAGTANGGASEVSVTPVAQVPAASRWDQFTAMSTDSTNTPSGTSASSMSSSATSAFSNTASTGYGDNTQPAFPSSPDATDKAIDNVATALDVTTDNVPKAVALTQNIGQPLPVIVEEVAQADAGLPISPTSPTPMFHQENTLLNDFNSASPSLFDTTGNAPYPGQFSDRINYDSTEGLNKAMVETIENAAPPLKVVDSLNQDFNKVGNFVTKKVNTITCLFSFNPYCK